MTSRADFEKWIKSKYPSTDLGSLWAIIGAESWQACTALHEAEIVAKDKKIAELKQMYNGAKIALDFCSDNNNFLTEIVRLELDNNRLREALQDSKSALVEFCNDETIPKDLNEIANESYEVAKQALSTPPSTKALDEYWNQAVEACAHLLAKVIQDSPVINKETLVIGQCEALLRTLKKEV